MYKTLEEAQNDYISKFGGFPYELTCCMSDDYVIKLIEKAIKTGKEISAKKGVIV